MCLIPEYLFTEKLLEIEKLFSPVFLLWLICSFVCCLGHPRYFNQLSSGLDVVGLAGEWLTTTANTNM